ncbi:hypothetical protein Q1M64_07100 (plasmid) [Sinorhizobium meliloti]|nr:hypothetical protein Q1M64_07100 [Sinorhizobium meliloti]
MKLVAPENHKPIGSIRLNDLSGNPLAAHPEQPAAMESPATNRFLAKCPPNTAW